MSDLGGAPRGNGRAANGGARGTAGPVPVTQASPSGVRTPRDIMNQRRAREAAQEARKQAEAQAETEEQLRIQDDQRRTAERRTAAAGVGVQPRDSGYRSGGVSAGGRTPAEPAYAPPLPGINVMAEEMASSDFGRRTGLAQPAEYPVTGLGTVGTSTRPRAGSQSQDQARILPQQSSTAGTSRIQQPQVQGRLAQATLPASQTAQRPSVPPVIGPASGEGTQRRPSNVTNFPHAFERWEDLSSRWEGLTSYWIRHLEQNTQEIERDPVARQMSRQITDLSAAGANLFHAVVELQRLRASSERKFQRWFFETRAEQERAKEAYAELKNTLDAERRGKSDVPEIVARAEQDSNNAERMVAQSRRELQISKEEARRAWEELGRKNQEERDRVAALKEGHPIWIGGIQVVPTQASVSRGGSLQRPQSGAGIYPAQPAAGGRTQGAEYGGYFPHDPSPTDTDPFTEGKRSAQPSNRQAAPAAPFAQYPAVPPSTPPPIRVGPPTAAQPEQPMPPLPSQQTSHAPSTTILGPSAQAVAAAPFYRHQDTFLHGPTGSSSAPRVSEEARSSFISGLASDDSEEEYEFDSQGNVRLDAQGRPITFRRPQTPRLSTDDQTKPETGRVQQGRYPGAQQYAQAEQGTSAVSTSTDPAPVRYARGYDGHDDFEGEGDAEGAAEEAGTGWEGIQPQRHHHPTRLSDVLEEDERSRTSPSRASQGSRGRY